MLNEFVACFLQVYWSNNCATGTRAGALETSLVGDALQNCTFVTGPGIVGNDTGYDILSKYIFQV